MRVMKGHTVRCSIPGMKVGVTGRTLKPWIGYCRGELDGAYSRVDNTDSVLLGGDKMVRSEDEVKA